MKKPDTKPKFNVRCHVLISGQQSLKLTRIEAKTGETRGAIVRRLINDAK